MRHYRTAALGLLATCATFASAKSVVDLDASNFKDFLNSHAVVMTEFYAPWCGVCKDLEPIYEETATMLDSSKDIKFARVDCVESKDICEEHRIGIFPTIFAFKGAEKYEIYNGKRESADMITFAEKRYAPPTTDLNANTIEGFKTSEKAVVVGYLGADDKTSSQTFTKVAEALLDDFVFGATTDAELAKTDGVSQPAIILYKQYDEGKAIYGGSFGEEDIKEFIKTASIPLIGDISILSTVVRDGNPVACIFAETEEEREKLKQELTPIAEKTKGKMHWITADASTAAKFASKFNLKDGLWPAIGILNNKQEKFPFPQERVITHNAVSEFIDDFLADKIPPHIKSEPIPAQDGPVTVVVRDNFRDVVIDSDEDVLVEFYAPWCGHCKKLAPDYERLARVFGEHSKDVVIAKVDATANDIDGHTISSFPTIKMFPAKAKDFPVQYLGNRTIEHLAQFVRDNSRSKVDILDALKTSSEDAASSIADKVKEAAGAVVDAVTGGGKDEL